MDSRRASITSRSGQAWFGVNMAAWGLMGTVLWRHMKSLADEAEDVLLLQLAPLNLKLCSLSNLTHFLDCRGVEEESIDVRRLCFPRKLGLSPGLALSL